jgi:hypothetical protein
MKFVRQFAAWLWRDLSKIALLGTWALSFVIPAWAAKAVNALQAWAPLSWVGGGFLGGLLAVIGYAIFGRARLWYVDATIKDTFYKTAGRINPLDDTFRNKRINLADLASPIDGALG